MTLVGQASFDGVVVVMFVRSVGKNFAVLKLRMPAYAQGVRRAMSGQCHSVLGSSSCPLPRICCRARARQLTWPRYLFHTAMGLLTPGPAAYINVDIHTCIHTLTALSLSCSFAWLTNPAFPYSCTCRRGPIAYTYMQTYIHKYIHLYIDIHTYIGGVVAIMFVSLVDNTSVRTTAQLT